MYIKILSNCTEWRIMENVLTKCKSSLSPTKKMGRQRGQIVLSTHETWFLTGNDGWHVKLGGLRLGNNIIQW